MSGDSYALDTNIVIALQARDGRVVERVAAADTVVLPSVVVGELYFGARKSGQVSRNIARLDVYLARFVVLDVDTITAQYYGQIRNDLRIIGRPIPENDIWIAATALRHGLTLATRDQHFQHVAGLTLAVW